MRLISQQATGVHAHADTTDDRAVGAAMENEEEAESEHPMEMDEEINTREHLVNRLRELLNYALSHEDFRDGASIQQLVMLVLDMQPGMPISQAQFEQLLGRVIDGLQMRHQRALQRPQSSMASAYERYINEFTEQLQPK